MAYTLSRATAQGIKYAVMPTGGHANEVHVKFDRGLQDRFHNVPGSKHDRQLALWIRRRVCTTGAV